MKEAVIITAKRTAVGKSGGMFKSVPPEYLAAPIIQQIVEEYQLDPESIDEVILGNAVGPGGNIARLCALSAGLPLSVPGVTVDRQCASGLEAINVAARLVQAGAGDIYLAGGVESTSLAPWKFAKPSSIHDPQGPQLFMRARFSPDEIGDPDMGVAAENVAEAYNISREAQDEFAYQSQLKAITAIESGSFNEEIVPVKGQITDQCPRKNLTIERLSALPPVFKEDGTVTAGNACPLNDGASIVLIMSLDKCKELGLQPILRFVDAVSSGVDPNFLGIGPVPAVRKLLKRQQLSVHNIDIVEFNEAFSAQVIASLNELEIPLAKVNRNGGALAIGHPYGASGAILITRLYTEMKRHHLKRGLATLGIGGGLGLATLVELIE
ncbi:thiolase family protein [Halalkalibacter lacteus]|uniref:thiolase family protein n=1 Tax=Halalkalibacter lacteus TaxID=3090663 RepID=UPI002FC942B4